MFTIKPIDFNKVLTFEPLKQYIMKPQIKISFVALLSLVMITISCSDDDATTTPQEVSTENLTLAAQVDVIDDASYDIVENVYLENVQDTRNAVVNSFFPDCATLDVMPNGDGSGTILVSFTEGCTLNNGAVVSGQITLAYAAVNEGTREVTYEYSGFTYNGHEVTGGGTVIRTFENENGNPQSVLTSSITVNFENSDVDAARTLSRTREWVEGVGSGTWTDNAFLITGNWDTTFTNGLSRSGEVTTALRREATCPYFVSGELAIVTQNDIEGTLDYGDGTCDNVAVITIAGQEFTIQL